ncbi:MAG TPA: SWIM zinc finger family protein [Chloroflexota bacterium]|jgi:hypothetical protein
MPWTVEQVLGLASDGSVARAGRELASPRKWRTAGYTDQAVWGECQGSAAEPYRTVIDLAGPAYRCSCPSRKIPCKHALGLFLLRISEPETSKRGEPPAWAAEWLTNRTRAEQSAAKPADPEKAAAEQQKRARRREQRIDRGVDDLELWLHDLLRAGLAETAQRSNGTFDQMAKRLVDAQASGLARFVRELAILPHLSAQWPERMLVAIGRIGLLIEAWRRLDVIDADLKAEVRSLIGIPESREDVLATPPVNDSWDVIGRRVIDGERLRVQRTWLWGRQTRRWALLLEFSAGLQALDSTFVPGRSATATLHFYSGALRLRALAADQPALEGIVDRLPAQPLDQVLRGYAEQLGRNPWLERAPAALQAVRVQRARSADRWWAVAHDGAHLPLGGDSIWQLAALSGGHPIDLFGEWDGYTLWPLSVVVEGRCVPLRAALQLAA